MPNTHVVVGRIVSASGKEFKAGDKVDAVAEFGCYLVDVAQLLQPIEAASSAPDEPKKGK